MIIKDNITTTTFAITSNMISDKSPTDRSIDDLILVRSTQLVCNRFVAAIRSGNSVGRKSSVAPMVTAAAKC